jgi:hypothetical protein
MQRRDLLVADPAVAEGSTVALSNALLMEQSNYLADIAMYLRRQNADVLATAVVKSTSQVTNGITDAYSHEVVFEVGGKPVEIFNLLAFSTWTGTVAMSVVSLSKVNDGIPFAAGDVYNFSIPTFSVFVMSATAAIATPLIVNGPSNTDLGGFFLYGYTIPDWEKLRNDIRR